MTLATEMDDLSRSTFDRSNCACEACKYARSGEFSRWNPEGGKLKWAVVHNYSYSPRQWSPKSVRNDADAYYLGVELETDNYSTQPDGSMVRGLVRNEVASDMRRPKTLWFSKRDGSVSGPEFVSHPATLRYWQSKNADLNTMLRMLVHAGFRSHDNDRCGMHISISKSAFENRGHLYRFLTLLHADTKWTLRLSQRSRESARRWASLESCSTRDQTARVADQMTGRARYWSTEPVTDDSPITNSGEVDNRYCALNAPYGQSRFEFRLPRGTLRLDRFMKNLEWTHAMVEYTRTARPAHDCVPAKFMPWVEENRALYPNLLAFMVERRMYTRTTTDTAPAPTRTRTARRPRMPRRTAAQLAMHSTECPNRRNPRLTCTCGQPGPQVTFTYTFTSNANNY